MKTSVTRLEQLKTTRQGEEKELLKLGSVRAAGSVDGYMHGRIQGNTHGKGEFLAWQLSHRKCSRKIDMYD